MRRLVAETPLRYEEFRVLWLSSVFAGVGFMSETVVLGWLLLDRTGSPFVVGLGIALRSLPNFLLGIPGGALADRMDRRLLLRLIGATTAVSAAVLGGLALTNQIMVWHILVFTFAGGAARALGQAARQSFAFDIVGPSQVIGGMAYMNMGQRLGGIVGSLGVGLLIEEWGAGEAYLAIALCHLLSSLAIMFARTAGQAAPSARPPVWQGVRECVSELQINRILATLVLLTAAVEVFGFSYQALVPSLARDLLNLGPGGLGLLNAIGSLGGMVAVLAVSLRGELHSRGLGLLVVLLSFGGVLILLGHANTLALALLAIALVSGLAALSDLLSQSLVQSAVANDLRGRAMGSWVLATGFGPIGHLQIGLIASVYGVTTALTVSGLLLLTLGLSALLLNRQIRIL